MSSFTPAQKKAYAIAMRKNNKQLTKRIIRGNGPYGMSRLRRPKMSIMGKGDYNFNKSKLDYPGVGSNIGSMIGNGIQHLVKAVTGFGDYRISANSLMGGLYDPPELHNKKDRSVTVCHREYLADITASSGFALSTYDINAGLVSTFPWLAGVSENFEEYRITGMIFEYKSLSADYTAASSAALGYVVMATQYNVYNPNFPDKKTMENYEFSNSGKPSESFIHPIECKRSLSPVSELFVRTGAVTQGDQRLYDLGVFGIATGGNAGSGVLGELWVTFEVELYKPKLVESIGYELLTDHFRLTSVTNAAPLGANQSSGATSSLGGAIGTSGTIYQFPASVTDGNYLFAYSVFGTGASVTTPTFTVSGGNKLTVWENGGQNYEGIRTSTTTNVFMYSTVIQITAGSATVTLASGTLPTTVTEGDLWVTQLNGSLA